VQLEDTQVRTTNFFTVVSKVARLLHNKGIDSQCRYNVSTLLVVSYLTFSPWMHEALIKNTKCKLRTKESLYAREKKI
jgi:hypothetical protein